MSKTTKIIAALGVVAGLGVAALPAFTYAAEVGGQVQISVGVDEAIAMTILGDADNSTAGVDVYNPENGGTIGNHTGGTYFNPAADPLVYQTSSSATQLLPNAIDETMYSTITVYTNAAAGYTLNVKDADSTLALVNTADNTATIPANASVAAGTSAWAYKVGEGSYTAITAGDVEVTSTNAPTDADGSVTTVHYGVSTNAAQKTGTYTDTIIYTATTNNGSGN